MMLLGPREMPLPRVLSGVTASSSWLPRVGSQKNSYGGPVRASSVPFRYQITCSTTLSGKALNTMRLGRWPRV